MCSWQVLASIGFDEWLVEKYGMDMCNYYVDGGVVEDEAEVKAAAKDEYFAMTNRVKMQWKLHENSMGWRAAHRMNQDTSKFEQNHELFVQQLGALSTLGLCALSTLGLCALSLPFFFPTLFQFSLLQAV